MRPADSHTWPVSPIAWPILTGNAGRMRDEAYLPHPAGTDINSPGDRMEMGDAAADYIGLQGARGNGEG